MIFFFCLCASEWLIVREEVCLAGDHACVHAGVVRSFESLGGSCFSHRGTGSKAAERKAGTDGVGPGSLSSTYVSEPIVACVHRFLFENVPCTLCKQFTQQPNKSTSSTVGARSSGKHSMSRYSQPTLRVRPHTTWRHMTQLLSV